MKLRTLAAAADAADTTNEGNGKQQAQDKHHSEQQTASIEEADDEEELYGLAIQAEQTAVEIAGEWVRYILPHSLDAVLDY